MGSMQGRQGEWVGIEMDEKGEQRILPSFITIRFPTQ